MGQFNALEFPPPKGRKILVQIISKYGHCNLNWYEVYFDETIVDKPDLSIYDEDDMYVGDVWFWKELDENV